MIIIAYNKTRSTRKPQTSSEAADPAKFLQLAMFRDGKNSVKIHGSGSSSSGSGLLLLVRRPAPREISQELDTTTTSRVISNILRIATVSQR